MKKLTITKEDVDLKAELLGIVYKDLGNAANSRFFSSFNKNKKPWQEDDKMGHWQTENVRFEAICPATGGRIYAASLRDLWYKMEEIV